MNKTLDFYFDFSSPYGYFAATRIDALASQHDRTAVWHPVLLGAVFKTTGAAPLPLVPLKGAYAMRDIQRSARFHGIPFRTPTPFPISTQLAARAMLWTQQAHGTDKAVEFAKQVYAAYFVDGKNITEAEPLAAVAATLDIDPQALIGGASDGAIKEQLKADVAMAMARGVFGSPFVIVDDEPFWGFDRFDQLQAFLKTGKT